MGIILIPKAAHESNYRKYIIELPREHQMLCTDIQVPAEEADKAFMRAWNFLVSHGLRYAAGYREMARDGKDELIRYRAREMGMLLERGRIREFDYGLVLKVPDHIEVTPVGKLAVIFLTGTQVTASIDIQCLYHRVSKTPYQHLGLFRILYKHEALVGYTYLR